MSQRCLSGFNWNGKPVGTETTLAKNKTYITGANQEVAILMVHNVFGWTLPNLRLLADHYAKEADATVFMPDFFDGEVVIPEMMAKPEAFDLEAFFGRHSKDTRFPEISSCARALKQGHGFKKLGAIGFCYGGWAVFQLGAKGNNLVDCISTAHPSLLTKEEINAIAVPVQILAPEHDPYLTPELKTHANSIIPRSNVDYDYQHFPGMTHGFTVTCDESDVRQKKAMERAKNAVVAWFAQMLHMQ